MKNTNCTPSNQITNEVNINLDVLCALVVNWIGGHINGADIIAVDNGGFGGRTPKLTK